MWKSCDVLLNGKMVTSPDTSLPWTTYLDTMMNFSDNAKNVYLKSAGYFEDDMDGYTSTDPTDDSNKGLKARSIVMQGSKIVPCCGPLVLPIFQTSRPILNKTDVTIRLYPADPEFVLISKEVEPTYKIEFTKAELIIKRLQPSEFQLSHIDSMLLSQPAVYTFRDFHTRALVIPSNLQNVDMSIFDGARIPSRITIVQMTEKVCAAVCTDVYIRRCSMGSI